jgi:hypothetical protein
MELAKKGDDLKGLRKIASALLTLAEEGEISAIKEIADRLDGKPMQATEITGKGGGEIEVNMNLTTAERARAFAAFIARTKADK